MWTESVFQKTWQTKLPPWFETFWMFRSITRRKLSLCIKRVLPQSVKRIQMKHKNQIRIWKATFFILFDTIEQSCWKCMLLLWLRKNEVQQNFRKYGSELGQLFLSEMAATFFLFIIYFAEWDTAPLKSPSPVWRLCFFGCHGNGSLRRDTVDTIGASSLEGSSATQTFWIEWKLYSCFYSF